MIFDSQPEEDVQSEKIPTSKQVILKNKVDIKVT